MRRDSPRIRLASFWPAGTRCGGAELASQSKLSRFENAPGPEALMRMGPASAQTG